MTGLWMTTLVLGIAQLGLLTWLTTILRDHGEHLRQLHARLLALEQEWKDLNTIEPR
jgi:phytoene/squalene synthetase